MSKRLKELLPILSDDVLRATSLGGLNGFQFAKFTNQAGAIFCGFNVLVELLQVNQLKKNEGADDTLTEFESDAILSMMREISQVMYDNTEEISEWADKRLMDGVSHD